MSYTSFANKVAPLSYGQSRTFLLHRLASFPQGCISVARSCVTCLRAGSCELAHMVELAITGLHLFNAQGCFFLNRTGLRVILTQRCVKWRSFAGAREDPFAKGEVFITNFCNSKKELRLMQATFPIAIDRRRRPPRRGRILMPRCEAFSRKPLPRSFLLNGEFSALQSGPGALS